MRQQDCHKEITVYVYCQPQPEVLVEMQMTFEVIIYVIQSIMQKGGLCAAVTIL